jgi:site-specific DNA recombinase
MPSTPLSRKQQSDYNGIQRCAVYARFSGDNQHESSIEDQIRECRKFADQKGWSVLDAYIRYDRAKTGKALEGRDGLDELVQLTQQRPRPFDCLLMYHTSRFARDEADAHQLKKTFRFFGVKLIFVADGLDSSASGFDTMFAIKAMQDAQFSVDLGAHVRKAQTGRFQAGYVPGGGTAYGFCRIPHENVNKRGAYGRFEVDYVEWGIDPIESPIVTRIFEAYAAGLSYAQIAQMLNQGAVKPPQAPRLRAVGSWSKSAIREMLRNERYIGIFRWNQTYQERNPITGKVVRNSRSEDEWLVNEQPDLRIIPQDLWDRVSEQRRIRSKNAKQLGGMARTPQSRTYLFSSRLFCGECGHKFFITNTNPPKYGCSERGERGTCHNRATIRQQSLESALLAALAANLADIRLRDSLVSEISTRIREQARRRLQMAHGASSKREALTSEKQALLKKAQNLAEAIGETGISPTLKSLLGEAEARIAAIDVELATATAPALPEFTDHQIRSFVDAQAHRFAEVLKGDPQTAKEELQKRVSRLDLTPKQTDDGPVYVVTGDVAIFVSEDAMQDKREESIALHCSFPLRVEVVPAGDGNGGGPWPRRPPLQALSLMFIALTGLTANHPTQSTPGQCAAIRRPRG